MITSYDSDPRIARYSPGDLLIRHTLADLGRRDFESFDIGIGEARYKEAVCNETITLVDSIVPVTMPGFVYAKGEAWRLAAKRRIKQTPWAFAAVQRVQAMLSSRGDAP